MSTRTAKMCFEENLQLFGDPHSQPEKFNLYNGLKNLADSLTTLDQKLNNVHSEVVNLQNVIRNLR